MSQGWGNHRHLRFTFVGIYFFLSTTSLQATHDDGLELEGDIIDGTDPGCGQTPVVNPAPPDWANLFEVGGDGKIQPKLPLPAGGEAASFTADDLSVGSFIDCSIFVGSNKNGDALNT